MDTQKPQPQTPLPYIALVSRLVTQSIDRFFGDRSNYPLLVAYAASEALKELKVASQVFYGQSAWIEVLEDGTLVWAGAWGDDCGFWLATEFGEVVDLTVGVSSRQRLKTKLQLKSQFSPPLLWSADLPWFYRYQVEGLAELGLDDSTQSDKVRRSLEQLCEQVLKESPGDLEKKSEDLQFPNEAILCPGRLLLDDSKGSFAYFDRALSVQSVPPAPFQIKN